MTDEQAVELVQKIIDVQAWLSSLRRHFPPHSEMWQRAASIDLALDTLSKTILQNQRNEKKLSSEASPERLIDCDCRLCQDWRASKGIVSPIAAQAS